MRKHSSDGIVVVVSVAVIITILSPLYRFLRKVYRMFDTEQYSLLRVFTLSRGTCDVQPDSRSEPCDRFNLSQSIIILYTVIIIIIMICAHIIHYYMPTDIIILLSDYFYSTLACIELRINADRSPILCKAILCYTQYYRKTIFDLMR